VPRIRGNKNFHRACGQTPPLVVNESVATTIATSYLNRVTATPLCRSNAFGL
jgi:hypothetical protein